MRLGYACINTTMGKSVTTNRTMKKKTFDLRGIDYISELALLNSKDIIKILKFNKSNNISFLDYHHQLYLGEVILT